MLAVRGDQRHLDGEERGPGKRSEKPSVRVPAAGEDEAAGQAPPLFASFASSRLRSSFLCTLPVVVIGSASMNSISRGYS